MAIKDKLQIVALEKAFKSVDKLKVEEKIHESYIYILEKAISMIKLTNARLENKKNLTDKKKKKEEGKIKLNKKIFSYVEKNKELLERNNELKILIKDYNEVFEKMKNILKF
jgi:hypothetical protein